MSPARKIRLGSLEGCKGEALPSYLGENLAGWLLPGHRGTVLPEGPGATVLLFQNERTAQVKPIPGLGRGLLVPVEWRKDSAHSPKLPAGIREVAEQLRAKLELPFGLHLASCLGNVDLSELPMEGNSISVPLAAALLVASTGGKGKPRVLSTGSLDSQQRVAGVDGIEAKLWAVQAWSKQLPPEDAVTVFVPEANAEEAQRFGGGLRVGRLPIREQRTRPRDNLAYQLSALLAEYETPPGRNDALSSRIAYLNRADVQARTDIWNRYHGECLAEELGTLAIIQDRDAVVRKPLVAVFNPVNPSLLNLLLHALRPTRLLLITSNGKEKFQRPEFLEEAAVQWEVMEETRAERTFRRVCEFLREGGVVDGVNGKSMMKIVLVAAAVRTGSPLVLVDQHEGGGRTVSDRTEVRVLAEVGRWELPAESDPGCSNQSDRVLRATLPVRPPPDP